MAQLLTTTSGQHGVVVVSQLTEPYARSETTALLAVGGMGLLVVLLAALVALRVTSQALAPVTQMAERAPRTGARHDLGQRFDLGPADDEPRASRRDPDHLLDRVAMAIRSEQRLTSELAHELRTP